jgi:hypothetical protein
MVVRHRQSFTHSFDRTTWIKKILALHPHARSLEFVASGNHFEQCDRVPSVLEGSLTHTISESSALPHNLDPTRSAKAEPLFEQ